MKQKINNRNRLKLPIGSKDYKAFIGPLDNQDIYASLQFNLLTLLGLREHHKLLDIGCGSLRAGKLFIPYLLPYNYYGLEPEKWLIEKGLEMEVGKEIVKIKKPHFSYSKNFDLSSFDKKFDYLLAQSIFSHASPEQIEKCLKESKKVMKKKAIFVANYLKGSSNYQGNNWVYPECVSYKQDFIKTLSKKYQLNCQEISWPHPNQLTWVLITHAENKIKIRKLDKTSEFLSLKNELAYTKERLNSMQNHPYIKFGLTINKINQFIKRLFANKRLE